MRTFKCSLHESCVNINFVDVDSFTLICERSAVSWKFLPLSIALYVRVTDISPISRKIYVPWYKVMCYEIRLCQLKSAVDTKFCDIVAKIVTLLQVHMGETFSELFLN